MKNMKDLENYKIYWEKWKLSKWRNTPCSWTERLNIVKMVILHKLTYKFNTIPIKIKESVSPNWKAYYKIHVETQRVKKNQGNIEEHNRELTTTRYQYLW